MRYDVIVVGGGPAGSTTARECAARGLSVLLLEKEHFPRDKPCGGGVTARAARLLPFDLTPVIERTIFGIHFSSSRRGGFARDADRPLFYLTQRCRLDHFLIEQAVKAGAAVRERKPLRDIERYRSHWVVRAGNGVFEGRTLVAADGASGPTTRRAGLSVRHGRIIAMEGNITPDRFFPEAWRSRVGIHLGAASGGYHWLFPKGEHLNIGIGGLPSVGSTLRRRLDEAVRAYGFDPASLWGLRAAPLPVRHFDAPLVDGNLLLVGDAAGLVDLLTGEGIYSAIWSGRAAARHLADYLSGETRDLEGYRREIEADLLPELQIAFQLWFLLHLAPGLSTKILFHRLKGKLSRRFGWDRFSLFLQGEDAYRDLKRDLSPLWAAVDWTVRPTMFRPLSRLLEALKR